MGKCTILACWSFTCAQVLAGERHCLGPGDLSADHVVNSLDYSLFADCLGGPALDPGIKCSLEIHMSADVDQDGDIDLLDISKFVVSFGNTYFDYGPYRDDKEAEYLAINLTGELRAPDHEYERIHRDLLLMSAQLPELASVRDWRGYGNRHLLVRLLDKDDRDEFDRLNLFYVGASVNIVSGLYLIGYCDTLDAPLLAVSYEQLDEVDHATPSYIGCTDSSCCEETIAIQVSNSSLFRYDFSYTYPSPEGELCYCWRERTIETDMEGEITLVSCSDSCLPFCP